MELLDKTDPAVRAQLSQLWETVFGDPKDYVQLFFDGAFSHCRCFLHRENGQAVSALYLLDCGLSIDGTFFSGYYLYAAATAPSARRRGLMGALIEEAKAALRNSGHSFIALVPANDGLYDYYARFGFETKLYHYAGKARVTPDALSITDADYYAVRACLDNAFHWPRHSFGYAMACLSYGGVKPYRTETGVLLRNESTCAELLSSPDDGGDLLSVRSPFSFPGAKKTRFGMLYSDSDAFRRAAADRELYMNLALD